MKKIIALLLFSIMPLVSVAQDKKEASEPAQKVQGLIIPVQAKFAENFIIKDIYFNRRIDLGGRGEVLEVEIIVKNLTDTPMDLYFLAVASTEVAPRKLSAFDRPLKQKEKLRQFVPFPDNKKNFEYPLQEKGKEVKDAKGDTVKTYLKCPLNPKEGINPETGKPYHLGKELVFRTYHLSPYRVNYEFFNYVTLIAYDNEGKPLYRQIWELNGYRR